MDPFIEFEKQGMMYMNKNNKKILSWAFYDWANSVYSTTVMAGFFPIFFEKYWSNPEDVIQSTYQLGIANSLSSIIIALIAPILGAIADKGSVKKKLLILFAFLGVVMTGGLWFVQQGEWKVAIFSSKVVSLIVSLYNVCSTRFCQRVRGTLWHWRMWALHCFRTMGKKNKQMHFCHFLVRVTQVLISNSLWLKSGSNPSPTYSGRDGEDSPQLRIWYQAERGPDRGVQGGV